MKYSEIPQETKELFERIYEVNNMLSPAWKSSSEEPYAIRRFNSSKSEDTQRFTDIDRHPEALKWMVPSEPSSSEEIDYLLNIDETSESDPRIIWAIVNEKDEPIGWIQFYKDSKIDDVKKAELGIENDALLLEVSYAKLFSTWPDGIEFIDERTNLDTDIYGSVVPNGLKQTLLKLANMEEQISKSSGIKSRSIYISAYTNPKHRASEIVLAGNGFVKKGTIDYDGEEDNLWIKKIN